MHVVSLYVSVCAIKFISIGIIIHTFPTNILKIVIVTRHVLIKNLPGFSFVSICPRKELSLLFTRLMKGRKR